MMDLVILIETFNVDGFVVICQRSFPYFIWKHKVVFKRSEIDMMTMMKKLVSKMIIFLS